MPAFFAGPAFPDFMLFQRTSEGLAKKNKAAGDELRFIPCGPVFSINLSTAREQIIEIFSPVSRRANKFS